MITGRQIRAARALLDWTAGDLAEKSGVTRESISRIEADTVQAREDSVIKIEKAFDDHGIEFLSNEGLRRKNRIIEVFDEADANRRLLDDIYKTMRDIGGEVLIIGVDEADVVEDIERTFLEEHIKRLSRSNVTERLLIKEGDTNFVGPKNTYRWLPEKYFSPYPLYIYGPKLALGSWAPSSRCVIIHDEAFAESTRRLFNFVWDHTKSPTKKAGT